MSDEELKKLIEQACHSKNDPRFIQTEIAVEENEDEVRNIQRTVKKRQCANCTCSRSKTANKAVPEHSIKPKSGCGSCALGDAFRCDGCPYKGMPAFKEGEEFKFEDSLNDI